MELQYKSTNTPYPLTFTIFCNREKGNVIVFKFGCHDQQNKKLSLILFFYNYNLIIIININNIYRINIFKEFL